MMLDNKMQDAFEDWFIHLHGDVDETLLDEKTDDGKHYTVGFVEDAWFAFSSGYKARQALLEVHIKTITNYIDTMN